MSTTRIEDLYNPVVFSRLTTEAQIERNAFISSGIMANDPVLALQASVGGNIGEMTGYKPMIYSEPNYSTDNPADIAGTEKISSQTMKYRKYYGNKGWSFMELARMINLQSGSDPVEVLTSQIGGMWANVDQTRVIRSSLGVLSDSLANHGGDMVVSVATDASGAVGASERINAELILQAKQTLGDHGSAINAIAMHSVTHTRLSIDKVLKVHTDLEGNPLYETYLGYRVIVDDGLPAIAGTNRITYTSILFAAGAFGYANVPTITPSERDRKADSGNGSGEDRIWSRTAGIIQPLGYSWTDASVAGQSATWAELQDHSNWNRVWDRKHCPMAFIQTND